MLAYLYACVCFYLEGTEEHRDLCKALSLIKDLIAAVDLQVNEYEKKQKLLEILSKIENKTYTKLKSGHVFRKQDLMTKQRTLLYDGLVYWKTATGRFKGACNFSSLCVVTVVNSCFFVGLKDSMISFLNLSFRYNGMEECSAEK